LLAVVLIAICAAGPAAADREPWPGGVPSVSPVRPKAVPGVRPKAVPRWVPRASVRPPVAPKKVSVDGSVPGVSVWRSPVPGVSIAGRPGKRRPVPKVTVPGMTIFPGSVCGERVQVGECPPRDKALSVPRPVPQRATPVRVPSPFPTPTPTPEVTPPVQAKQVAPPSRRKSPLGTVLVMVVLVTTIASTTTVAFRARR
jgi:hypothetical protein